MVNNFLDLCFLQLDGFVHLALRLLFLLYLLIQFSLRIANFIFDIIHFILKLDGGDLLPRIQLLYFLSSYLILNLFIHLANFLESLHVFFMLFFLRFLFDLYVLIILVSFFFLFQDFLKILFVFFL